MHDNDTSSANVTRGKVMMTFKELLNFASNGQLSDIGVNPWYANEGGDTSRTKEINYYQWANVLRLPDEEWERRHIDVIE